MADLKNNLGQELSEEELANVSGGEDNAITRLKRLICKFKGTKYDPVKRTCVPKNDSQNPDNKKGQIF